MMPQIACTFRLLGKLFLHLNWLVHELTLFVLVVNEINRNSCPKLLCVIVTGRKRLNNR